MTLTEQPGQAPERVGDEVGRRSSVFEERVTEVYLYAVRNPEVTRDRLLAAAMSPDLVDMAVAELTARGLIRPGGAPDSWEAIPPDVALPAMAARLDHHAANARAMAGDLAQIYRQARARGQDGGGEGVRVITSMSELHNATGAVRCGAQRELRAIYDGSPRTAHMFALSSGAAGDRPVAEDGRPVRVRATYDAAVLRLPQAWKVLADRAVAGEESRFVSRLPFSVIVADDTVAVVDLTSYDSSGMGSLLARDHRVVLGLAALVDSYWTVATPTTEQGRDGLDQRQVFILTMLAAGATDAIIAEQSGLSQRTVERTVRALMARLGASTRFQAGIQAARRGWL